MSIANSPVFFLVFFGKQLEDTSCNWILTLFYSNRRFSKEILSNLTNACSMELAKFRLWRFFICIWAKPRRCNISHINILSLYHFYHFYIPSKHYTPHNQFFLLLICYIQLWFNCNRSNVYYLRLYVTISHYSHTTTNTDFYLLH